MRRHGYDIDKIIAENIAVGDRLRTVSEERVAALAASIKEIGLKTPITVRIVNEEPTLVAGATRLAAALKLGWEEIDCFVIDGDEIDAQLWEIDENLARTDLSTEEKREHLRRRKEIWEQKQREERAAGTPRPTSLRDGRKAGPQHEKNFAAETAAATGMSKRQINRLLADPVPRPAPKPQPPARPAINDIESVERQLDRLRAAWNSAGPEARRRFLDEMDKPVFDQTKAA